MNIHSFDFLSFFEVYFFTGIALLAILIFYDWGLFAVQKRISLQFYELKKKLLYHPTLLIWAFEADNFINQFLQFIRLKWVTISYENDGKRQHLYYVLNGGALKALLQLMIGFLFFSRFALLALIISCLIYFRTSLSIFEFADCGLKILQSVTILFQKLLPEINNFLILLPSFVLLITIIVTNSLISMKGQYQTAIRQANKDYLADLVKIHRELSHQISYLIYKGCQNLNRALEVYHKNPYYSTKDSIVKYRMLELSPHISEVEKNAVVWEGKNRNYYMYGKNEPPAGFNEIPAINKIFDIIDRTKMEEKYHDLFSISRLNKKTANLLDLSHFDRKSLNKIMLTKSALKIMVEEANKNCLIYKEIQDSKPSENIEYYNKEILDERDSFKNLIDDSIIDGIELIISLMKYVNAVDKTISFRKRKISDIISQLFGGSK